MNVSNFILTKETKEKMGKQISLRRKGELRLAKLRELAESGKLSMIKSKGDLAEAVGYPYSSRNGSGYQWVKYKIDQGWLTEKLTGYEDGIPVYEYQFIDKNKEMTEKKVKQPTPVLTNAPKETSGTVITITNNDTTIKLDNVSTDVIIEIIKMITKG